MKNGLKVNLNDIKVQDVSTSCVMLVSKFSRLLKAKHNVVLKLQEPKVLNKVAAYASSTNSAQLKIIYDKIESEIVEHLQKKNSKVYDHVVFKHKREAHLFTKNT